MADYRTFCHSCNNEIGFGSHKPGCPVVKAADDARKAKRDWDNEIDAATRELTPDELLEELKQGREKIGYLDDAIRAEQKRYDYLRYAFVSREGNYNAVEKLREAGLLR